MRTKQSREEIVTVRAEAGLARIKAHLAGDTQSEALAADIAPASDPAPE